MRRRSRRSEGARQVAAVDGRDGISAQALADDARLFGRALSAGCLRPAPANGRSNSIRSRRGQKDQRGLVVLAHTRQAILQMAASGSASTVTCPPLNSTTVTDVLGICPRRGSLGSSGPVTPLRRQARTLPPWVTTATVWPGWRACSSAAACSVRAWNVANVSPPPRTR